MDHPLEAAYGLTANEILDIVGARFRLKVALEGGVAECQMERHVAALVGTVIDRYEATDEDGMPDFKLWLPGQPEPIKAECKNARNQSYKIKGAV